MTISYIVAGMAPTPLCIPSIRLPRRFHRLDRYNLETFCVRYCPLGPRKSETFMAHDCDVCCRDRASERKCGEGSADVFGENVVLLRPETSSFSCQESPAPWTWQSNEKSLSGGLRLFGVITGAERVEVALEYQDI